MDWFLYDISLRHERVKGITLDLIKFFDLSNENGFRTWFSNMVFEHLKKTNALFTHGKILLSLISPIHCTFFLASYQLFFGTCLYIVQTIQTLNIQNRKSKYEH